MNTFSKIELPFKLDINLFYSISKILIILILGFFLIRLISNVALKIMRKKLSEQAAMIIRKIIFYTGIGLIVLMVLNELGIGLTPFLGAAGIIGIAVGFASQTSISNLISGFFLISEKPFEVGDLIKVGDTMGNVLSIDLLSVKIRTFSNAYVRVPSEKILNSELTNLTHFPIRRIDFELTVDYKTDFKKLNALLLQIAENNPACLDEPNPLVVFKSFGASGIDFLFAVWCEKNDFLKLKNSIAEEIKKSFDAQGIEFPFPQLTLHSSGQSLPITVIKSK